MKRGGNVYMKNVFCGIIYEDENGYYFKYDSHYIENNYSLAISVTMPISQQVYHSKTLFPYFDGLIPEGWLLDIAEKNWKINYKDRMGLLLTCCKDCIGAVSVEKNEKL
jgi:serine/threonine-protein kinase HipA